jgi:hypothetical protein
VRAATIGGVTFDGGGGAFGGISFVQGAHDQTWDGFHFANGVTDSTGVVLFGGYTGWAAPHNIALKHITIDASCHRANSGATDHGVYLASAVGGPHDILIEDLTVVGTDSMGLWSAIHADHGDTSNPASHDVTIRRLKVTGTHDAMLLWTPPLHNWLIDGATITNASQFAVRFESVGAQNIQLRGIVSTGSGSAGFYSSMGAHPAGVTFVSNSFH